MTSRFGAQTRVRLDTRPPVVLRFPVPESDVGLVTALRANHPDARRALCERYSGELIKVATRVLGPDPGVETIVIETLRRALLHLDELAEPRSIRHWLLSQLVILAGRRLRTKRLWQHFSRGHARNGFGSEGYGEQLVSTYRLLDRLGVHNRLVFCLVVIHSMGLTETSTVLGITYFDVKTRLAAAHARFNRLVHSRDSPITQRHSSPAALGIDVVNEQDRVHRYSQIFEFDLREKANRMRWRTVLYSRPLAWIPALTPLLVALAIAIAVSLIYFQKVSFQVNDNVDPSTESSRIGAWIVARQQRPKTVSFNDGSTIALAPGARMRIMSTTYRGSAIVLESGATKLSVVDSGRAEYAVTAGPFVVRLTKGQADISWDLQNERLNMTAHQSNVVLSGCQFGTGHSIDAGTSFRTRCQTQ